MRRSKKNLLYPLIIFTCSITSLQAKIKVEGYYVTFKSKERINATFVIPVDVSTDIPNYARMWDRISYVTGEGETAIILPKDVREVRFFVKNKEIILRSCFDNLRVKEGIFMHLILDGAVCLYDYYVEERSNATGTNEIIFERVVKRETGPIIQVGNVFYKTDLINFLSDCPLITDQIKSGSLKGQETIIAQYNAQCAPPANPGGIALDKMELEPDQYGFAITLQNDSIILTQSKTNILNNAKSIEISSNGETQVIRPSETKSVSCITPQGVKWTGVPADSCWLFKILWGRINLYSTFTRDDMYLCTAFSHGNGPITPLTKETLLPYMKDDRRAVSLIKGKLFVKAVLRYNNTLEK